MLTRLKVLLQLLVDACLPSKRKLPDDFKFYGEKMFFSPAERGFVDEPRNDSPRQRPQFSSRPSLTVLVAQVLHGAVLACFPDF